MLGIAASTVGHPNKLSGWSKNGKVGFGLVTFINVVAIGPGVVGEHNSGCMFSWDDADSVGWCEADMVHSGLCDSYGIPA